jgi:GntR family transcriptional regulator, vanillate catabolism transcriptional regulator
LGSRRDDVTHRREEDFMSRRLSASSQTIRVLVELRGLLLSGHFAPGQRLAEQPLVERFGVSRSPLRIALVTLEQEGLVEHRKAGGYVARPFEPADLDDTLSLLQVLEGTAARLAAERGERRPDLLARLRDCTDQIDASLCNSAPGAESARRYLESNRTFHGLIIRLASSRVLTHTRSSAIRRLPGPPSQPELTAAKLLDHDFLLAAQRQHRALLQAIVERDGALAERIAREHWYASARELRQMLMCASIAEPTLIAVEF